ncbi:MAG TPA: hypothetical protein ENF54_04570 [Desulfobacteraceae bacterium]|nr:hypothetical protein [Desulfobacteraceae bacterium]
MTSPLKESLTCSLFFYEIISMSGILYAIYLILSSSLFLSSLPFFILLSILHPYFKDSLRNRLGNISSDAISKIRGKPRVWIHASSIGEVNVAYFILKELRAYLPENVPLLSVTTPHGIKKAKELLGKDYPIIFSPLDNIITMTHILNRVRPELIIFIETEIWPIWVYEAKRRGAAIILLNGRVSDRSYGRYRFLKPFLRHILKRYDLFSMIAGVDRDRIVALGGDSSKAYINGNAKFQILEHREVDTSSVEYVRSKLKNEDKFTIVAGSTRPKEEEIILKAFKILYDRYRVLLVLAPRHIQRKAEIGQKIRDMGFNFHLWSRLKEGVERQRIHPIILVDTFGDLFRLYGASDVVFCGASLVPLGGQNPLEAVYWRKPVLFGLHMEDFSDIARILVERGIGKIVKDHKDMALCIEEFIRSPEKKREVFDKIEELRKEQSGSTRRHVMCLLKNLRFFNKLHEWTCK